MKSRSFGLNRLWIGSPGSPWYSCLECHGRRMTKIRILEEWMASCLFSMTFCFGVRGFKPLKRLKASQRVLQVTRSTAIKALRTICMSKAADSCEQISTFFLAEHISTYVDSLSLVWVLGLAQKWEKSSWIELRKICIEGYWRLFALMAFEGSDNCNQLYSSSGSLLRWDKSDKSQKYFPVLLEWQNDLCIYRTEVGSSLSQYLSQNSRAFRQRSPIRTVLFLSCASTSSPLALVGKHMLYFGQSYVWTGFSTGWMDYSAAFFPVAYAGCTSMHVQAAMFGCACAPHQKVP